MKKSIFLKAGILLLSLSLTGCFVAYRAGAFSTASPKDGVQRTEAAATTEEPFMPSTKSMELPAKEQPSEEDLLIGSSKSGKIFSVDSPRKELPIDNAPERTFMGSSKNDGIFEPEPIKTNQTDSGNQELFMNSSKSGNIFKSPPRNNSQNNVNAGNSTKQTDTNDTRFMGSSKSAVIFQPKTDTIKPKNNQPPK